MRCQSCTNYGMQSRGAPPPHLPFSIIRILSRPRRRIQALLNICYPLSRVYVGKRVDVSVGVAMRYIFFWSTLLAWKLYFSYKYEVRADEVCMSGFSHAGIAEKHCFYVWRIKPRG